MFDGHPYEQQLDARLFLLALRELLYAVDMELKEVKRLAPDAHGGLAAARARFEDAVPDLVNARSSPPGTLVPAGPAKVVHLA
jgi:hypothetical protein